jgi:transcriptional regulator with XRE-family HTH domain/Tfp pilus assembly protein PilF
MAEQLPKTRLQAERMKRQWTQSELATMIDIDLKTLSRWERGVQDAGHQRLRKLSEVFGEKVDKSWLQPLEIEIRPWRVPNERNPHFTDHRNLVQHLHDRLTSGEVGASRQSISGLGGIGKTQLALEYAYHYQDYYAAVLWIRAGTQAQMLGDLSRIAELLQIPKAKNLASKPQYLVNEIVYWLRTHSNWLLVFDNVDENPDDEENIEATEKDIRIDHLLSLLKEGHILLTTRVQSVANLAQNFQLEEMQSEEGAQLLLLRSNQLSSPDILKVVDSVDRKEALALSQLLGGLPLALEQARAYIEATGCGLAGYRRLFEEFRKEILQSVIKGSRLNREYQDSVATTWLISFRRVEQQFAVASDLLRLCAYFAPEAIPDAIVLKGAGKLDSGLRQLAKNSLQFNLACQVLLNYSLIKRSAKEETFSIHRLVQVVLQDSMDEDKQRFWAEQAVQALELAFHVATEQESEQYIPHAQVCASSIKKFHLEGQAVAELLKMAAKAVDIRGWFAHARPLYMQAFDAFSTFFGPNHPRTLSVLRDVAHLHMDLGAAPLSAMVYQKLADHLEQVLGPDNPDLLDALNYLAWAQLVSRDYMAVAQTCIKALQMLERNQGRWPTEQAMTYQIAAEISVLSGKDDLAEAYYQGALALQELTLGPNHPEVASTLSNYGAFLLLHQDIDKGEALLHHALEIRQKVLGRDHPETADSLVCLAAISWRRKNYKEVEDRYQQALEIYRQKLGPYHPDVLSTLRLLAKLASQQNKAEEADLYYQEAFDLAPHAGGKETHIYYNLLKDYADFLQERGLVDEANSYRKQVVDLEEHLKTRGPQHSLTLVGWDEEGNPRPTTKLLF